VFLPVSDKFLLSKRFHGKLRLLSGLLVAVVSQSAFAQAAASSPVPVASAPLKASSAPVLTLGSSSAWSELTPAHRQALAPLANQWSGLTEAQKRKWLALSRNYASMSVGDRAKLHAHMTDWVALTPQQRSQARLNFGSVKQLSAEEKQAKWQAYQSLSAADKNKLAATGASGVAGAAPAVKPIPPARLASVPKPPAAPDARANSASPRVEPVSDDAPR